MSVELVEDSVPKPILEEHSFTFVNNCLVDKFYKYMADVYIEHQQLQINKSSDSLNGDGDGDDNTKPLQSFSNYFLYKLYYNYGVKRRMANEYIALLYYSKTAKGYKNTEPITMLCRHMLLDLRYMRIISLGIPKAVKLDEFCKNYSIDKTNPETNYNLINDVKNQKYRLYYFSEGTMMTYNPSLKKYNITIINTDCDDVDEDADCDITTDIHDDLKSNSNNKIDLDQNIEIQFNNQFMYSTRKILGTGNFGSNKSFLDMFEENNKVYNTNLNIIPSDLIKDTVLVFNIEHPENNIISTIKRNTNTLCAVFRFKPEDISQTEFNKIIDIKYIPDNELLTNLIYESFTSLFIFFN